MATKEEKKVTALKAKKNAYIKKRWKTDAEFREYHAEYSRKYYKRKRDELLAKQKENNEKKEKKVATYQQEYYQKNKKKLKEYQEKYYDNNKPRYKKYMREYYKDNIKKD